ncbi:MAG TPA: Ni/Fe hydrogenase subunit alpha, partial [Acidimicrobiales bacterium]
QLARVEGEGALRVEVTDGVVTDVELRIFEPPRFFEGFLRGRAHTEPPDITARICGICPVAYQMSSCAAIEDLCGVAVTPEVRALRRLLYAGEWIESHALHVYLLHAPDFLGYENGIALAADHRATVEMGLRLKKLGNELMEVVGGRAIHPVNVRVGGFYKAPACTALRALLPALEQARADALETVQWVAGFSFPEVEVAAELVALEHPGEYPVMGERIVSSEGLDIAVQEWPEHFREGHVARSTALHSHRTGGGHYLTGPLARYTLFSDRLAPVARAAAEEAGLGATCRNPFRSIVVRSVETLHAVDEAIRLIDDYVPPQPPAVDVPPRAGEGHGASEAPRGLLYHRYRCDAGGLITEAQIVPPTSQNQPAIEDDLRAVAQRFLDAPHDELVQRCETAVRNHDPCISCATHFLTVEVLRR